MVKPMILLIREYNKAGILHECLTIVTSRRSAPPSPDAAPEDLTILEGGAAGRRLLAVRPFALTPQYPTLILARAVFLTFLHARLHGHSLNRSPHPDMQYPRPQHISWFLAHELNHAFTALRDEI